ATGKLVRESQDLQVYGNLYFDPTNRRVLGIFHPTNRRPRLAWFHVQTGELTNAIADGAWPGPSIGTTGLEWPRIALSHSGKTLAVVVTRDQPNEQPGNQGPQVDVWLVSMAGGPPRPLVTWPARIHDLCWSAKDDALIVATERGGVHNNLWRLPIERSGSEEKEDTLPGALANAKQLTDAIADEGSPSVSNDGRWLAYTDNRSGPTQIVLRDLSSDRESNVMHGGMKYDRPTGKVALTLVEGPDARPATARIVIQDTPGKFYAPSDALYRVLGKEMHFYADQTMELELPVGRYVVKATRGPEHRITREAIEVESNSKTSRTLQLERWTSQAADGWYSGENHIHGNYGYGYWYNSPTTILPQITGEDLNVANMMVANSDGEGVYDQQFFLGRPDPLSNSEHVLYWNEEFRSSIYGHMTLLNLKSLVQPIYTGFKGTPHSHDTPTNADIAHHVHEQDGVVNYTHPAHSLQDPYAAPFTAKELPIDLALGTVDTIDVMGSNHRANLAVWYRLLNCGFHLPASAGTDCFLNRIPSRLPGGDRVYVHCREGFTYEAWHANLKAGKTFVTNGPMLRLNVGDSEPGDTIELEKPATAQLRVRAWAPYPLEALELIVNGKIQTLARPADQSELLEFQIDQSITLDRSSWIAVRVKGSRDAPTKGVEAFAHSSPIYLRVAGQPVRSATDAKYFIVWIERLREDLRKRNQIPAEQWPHVEEQLAKALDYYRSQITDEPTSETR
ncbi:MAG: hypothetical protein RIS70_3301, partial [Planctomycetota bacterium]